MERVLMFGKNGIRLVCLQLRRELGASPGAFRHGGEEVLRGQGLLEGPAVEIDLGSQMSRSCCLSKTQMQMQKKSSRFQTWKTAN